MMSFIFYDYYKFHAVVSLEAVIIITSYKEHDHNVEKHVLLVWLKRILLNSNGNFF